MIKSVLALVFLLHCCCADFNLNNDIKERLEKLDVLYQQGKATITSAGPLREPGRDMYNNASSCVGNYTRELKHLLNDVSVSQEEGKKNLQELKLSVQALDHKQIGHKCGMRAVTNVTLVFKKYIKFLRKLNDSKRR